ncbi:MAG: calcium/sodium antiporter [Rhodospirillales bacterium]|nr:calcium/sodium antiporter [Rhodospirillales bacterium]
MWMDLGFLAGGLVLLFLGGEALVRGSVAVAEKLGISKLVVGLIVVGFGTSAPELLVSIRAALAGAPDIAVGNVVGSNIANILLIVGVAALISPLANGDRAIRRDAIIMAVFSAGLVALLQFPEISRIAGAGMLAVLTLYLTVTYVSERRRRDSEPAQENGTAEKTALSILAAAMISVVGILLLVAGARLLVDGATGVAREFGISEAVIGLTAVAVGTSLPELATAIVAAYRRHAEVVLANVIGSSIFNILAILGVTAVILPIPVAARFGELDGPIMLGVALAAVIMVFAFRRIGRRLGLLMLTAYVAYIVLQVPIEAAGG